jgi:hypothetical protein
MPEENATAKKREKCKVGSLVALLVIAVAFIVSYVVYDDLLDESLKSATEVCVLVLLLPLLQGGCGDCIVSGIFCNLSLNLVLFVNIFYRFAVKMTPASTLSTRRQLLSL